MLTLSHKCDSYITYVAKLATVTANPRITGATFFNLEALSTAIMNTAMTSSEAAKNWKKMASMTVDASISSVP